MFQFEYTFDGFSCGSSSRRLRKYSVLSGLSKKGQLEAISLNNKKIGKERRSSKKRPRFIETLVVFEDNLCDDIDEEQCDGHDDDFVSECGSYNLYSDTQPVEPCFNTCVPDSAYDGHLPIRQIFERWEISHVMTNGVGGDGWNIGVQICTALIKGGHVLLPKVGTPPVRVYDMNDPKVVGVIGTTIAQYLIEHKMHDPAVASIVSKMLSQHLIAHEC